MSQRDIYILGGLIAVGAIARFATLDLQSFHHDEAVTVGRILQPGLGDTITNVGEFERSPDLYYILAWGWTKIFGLGEVGIRSLSALIGTLVIPAAFLATRRFVGVRTGLIAAALIALDPYLIWYSQEARSYELMILLLTVSFIFMPGALIANRNSLIAWAATAALALGSHYFAAAVIIPQAIWILAASTNRRRVIPAVLAVGAAGLLLLPLALSQQGEDRRDAFTDSPLITRVAEIPLDVVASDSPGPLEGDTQVDLIQGTAALAAALLLALACYLLISGGSGAERRAAAIYGSIVVSAIGFAVLMAIVGFDLIKARNLAGVAVPALLFLAVGFGVARKPKAGLAGAFATATLFACVVFAVNISAQMQRPDWRNVASEIGTSSEPRLVVVPKNGDDPMVVYLDGRPFNPERHSEGENVSEVVAVSTNLDVEAPPRFKLISKQGIGPQFVLWRFASTAPQLLTPADLAKYPVLSERSQVLLQEPSR